MIFEKLMGDSGRFNYGGIFFGEISRNALALLLYQFIRITNTLYFTA